MTMPLVIGKHNFNVPNLHFRQTCYKIGAVDPGASYCVDCSVSREVAAAFVGSISGETVEITSDNAESLMSLCDKMGNSTLQSALVKFMHSPEWALSILKQEHSEQSERIIQERLTEVESELVDLRTKIATTVTDDISKMQTLLSTQIEQQLVNLESEMTNQRSSFEGIQQSFQIFPPLCLYVIQVELSCYGVGVETVSIAGHFTRAVTMLEAH
jgi:hypothetical protein